MPTAASPRHPSMQRHPDRSRDARSGRHLQWDEVARGHGAAAAHDDDRPEEVLDLGRGIHVARRRSADHAAEEPAWPVHSDEASQAFARSAVGAGDHGDLGEQLGAERALALLDAAALLPDLLADLLT